MRLVFVFALGMLLAGCGGPEDKEGVDTNALNAAARSAEEGASSTKLPPRPSIAEVAANEIDEVSIRESLARLTGASPAPLSNGPTMIAERGSEEGRRAAARYMEESFEAMGIPARILEFNSGARRGFNVEATLEGTESEKHLWVTAHLDSVFNAGANDDASGLVSILLTARVLEQLNPKYTVHFVAYDLEEYDEFEEVSLEGSLRYVGSAVSDIREREGEGAIIGNLHSDMIGYDEGADLDAVLVTCGRAGPIDEAVLRASEIIDSPITLDLSDECLHYSDHKHFWDAGLPAVLMIESTAEDDYNPWFHQPGDTIDKINIPYLRSMIQLNAVAAALLAAPESESRRPN